MLCWGQIENGQETRGRKSEISEAGVDAPRYTAIRQ